MSPGSRLLSECFIRPAPGVFEKPAQTDLSRFVHFQGNCVPGVIS
jgi:hypothetical protein